MGVIRDPICGLLKGMSHGIALNCSKVVTFCEKDSTN